MRKRRKMTAAERRKLKLPKGAAIVTVDLHDPNLAPEHRDNFITGVRAEVVRLEAAGAFCLGERVS